MNTDKMLKVVLCLLMMAVTSLAAIAQDSLGQVELHDEVLITVEQMPAFPGGEAEMLKYISTHVDYPDEAANDGITGRVMVRFIVNTDGSLSGIQVVRSVHPLLDSASVHMVREMPKWIPGKLHGRAVRTQVIIPVRFSFQTLPPDKDSIYTIVQKMPSFPGGTLALDNYLDTALKYPPAAIRNVNQGNVYITCIIDKTGKIRSAEIFEGFDAECNKEALRMILASPQWSPGKVRGFPVEVRQTIAVPFIIDGEYLLDGSKYVEDQYLRDLNDTLQFTSVQLPQFPGGEEAMMQFISANLVYPEMAVKKDIEGRVLVQFVVDEHGEIEQARVINICYYELADAALNVVNTMPKWTPGMADGLPVKVSFVLPIRFKLR